MDAFLSYVAQINLHHWVVIVGTISGIFIAVRTIRQSEKNTEQSRKNTEQNRTIAQKKASIDFVLRIEEDSQVDEGLSILRLVKAGVEALPSLSEDVDNRQRLQPILSALNTYEILATGIRVEAFCEETIKRSTFSLVNRAYVAAKPLIRSIRDATDAETPFQELEWLYERWNNNPLAADGNKPQ